MEKLADLYKEFKADALAKTVPNSKAEKIRRFVQNFSDYIGEVSLCFDATFRVACIKITGDKKLTKVYFRQVVSKEWVIEEDDDGVDWIRIDLPRVKK